MLNFITNRFYYLYLFFSIFLIHNDAFSNSENLNVVWNSQTQYSDIASSLHRVCAVAQQDGSVHCWNLFSDNDFSGLPQNETVFNTQKFLTIVVADTHVCALASDNNWYCSGYNQAGQLGNGTNTNSGTMTQVQTPNGVHLTKFILNNSQSCALSDTQDLYCWGSVRQADFSLANINIPTLYSPNTRWKVVTLGGDVNSQSDYLCGISIDNKSYCKGNNSSGQLGNNSQDIAKDFSLVNVTNNNFISISAGLSHTCALTSDGSLYCFGSNSRAQLAVPAYTYDANSQEKCTSSSLNCSDESAKPILVNSTEKFIDISTKGNSTCAKTTQGYVYCFGDNSFGQLNVLPTDTHNAQIITDIVKSTDVLVNHPVQLSDLSFYKVTLGQGSTCGLVDDSKTSNSKIDHTLQCYGFLNRNKYTQVAIGENTGCGISYAGSRLFCWNKNLTNSYSGFSNPWTSGFQVPWATTEQYNYVAESENFACAIRSIDNKLACFSNKEDAIIPGILTSINSYTPKIMPFNASGAFINQFKKVAVNEDHICAIQIDGLAFCWGNNLHGQLGNNSLNNSSIPVQVVGENGVAANFQDIAVGNNHSCGITQDNSIYCWGDNSLSQSGSQTTKSSSVAKLVTNTNISNLKFNSIIADKNYTCAKSIDGNIACFGTENSGSFLHDVNNNLITNLPIPTVLNLGFVANQISSKNGTLCALSGPDNQNALYCWGNNQNGQVDTTNSQSIIFLAPVHEKTTENAFYYSVSVGSTQTCAIRNIDESKTPPTLLVYDKSLDCFGK